MDRILLLVALFLQCSLKTYSQPIEGVDYIGILKYGGDYTRAEDPTLPDFTYQSSNAPELKALRKDYNLDSIAGFGNETSRLLNLLHWVHNTVGHDGQNETGIDDLNGREVLKTASQKGIGVSCGELATLLNDCYLAMGWASRKVYCLPLDSAKTDQDSHVINAVYLSSQRKWVWVDPTHDAYVMNENGELLSIAEVRQRLKEGRPLLVNPDANWNRRVSSVASYYLLRYMAKNLYCLYSPLVSSYGYESKVKTHPVTYVYLLPGNHLQKVPARSERFRTYIGKTATEFRTSNDEQFWKAPGSGKKGFAGSIHKMQP